MVAQDAHVVYEENKVELENFIQRNDLMESEDGEVAQDKASYSKLPVVQEVQLVMEDTQEMDQNS